MDCSLPGSSVHGIFQARVLERDAIAFSEVAWLLLPTLGALAKCRHPRLTWDVPSVECSCQAMGRGCTGVDGAHPRQGNDDFALEELQ